MVATDGSKHGDRAVDLAKSIAQQGKSKVVVVHVTELVGGKGGTYVPISQQVHQVVIGAVTPLRAYSGLMYPPSSEAEPG